MKRWVLWVSVLAAWFLVFSTLFSLRVEQWMVPSVIVAEPREEGFDTVLTLDCLFDTEEGLSLFAPYEGAAWEAGTRVRIIEPASYQLTQDRIQFRGSLAVAYATKLPRPDALVDVIVTPKWEPDTWLAVAREDTLPEWGALDRRASIQTQTEQEALLALEKAPVPFMEKQAWGMAPIARQEDDLSPWADESGNVDKKAVDWLAVEAARQKPPRFYSLNDLSQWTAQMPKMGLGAGLVLAFLVLWGFSWPLARDWRKNSRRLAISALLTVASLGVLAGLLWAIELPSSLLPSTHIVDFGHYTQEFSAIFRALERLAAAGDVTAADAVSQANTRLWLSLASAAALPLAAAVLGLGQVLLGSRKNTHSQERT